MRSESPRVRARYLEYVLYARSMLRTADAGIDFQTAYRDTFRALIQPLDNRTSAIVTNELSFDKLFQATQDFQQDLDRIRGRNSISMSESQKLIRDYNDREIYRAVGADER